jgi:hypothetical protein
LAEEPGEPDDLDATPAPVVEADALWSFVRERAERCAIDEFRDAAKNPEFREWLEVVTAWSTCKSWREIPTGDEKTQGWIGLPACPPRPKGPPRPEVCLWGGRGDPP